MGYRTGTADNYLHLLDLLRQCIQGWVIETARTFTGSGNGTLTLFGVTAAAVAETWTLTFTSATTFHVVGSVSGAAADGTVGVAYTNTWLTFTMVAGTNAFHAGDVFTVTLGATPIASGDRWTIDRWTPGSELICHGPGGGSDAIYVGMQTAFNATGDWYNWRLAGFTGFTSANLFDNQPGSSESGQASPVHLPLWNASIPFWLMVSGRRLLLVAKVSTAYVTMYLGFLHAYPTPGQYPYPLAVGGSLAFGNSGVPANTSANWRWSSAFARACWDADFFSGSIPSAGHGPMRVRLANGSWRDFYAKNNGSNLGASVTAGTAHYAPTTLAGFDALPQAAVDGEIWPSCQAPSGWADALDGSKVLLPTILGTGIAKDPPDGDLVGELDGIARLFTTGISAEQTVNISGTDWLIVPDVSRSTSLDYAAIQLA